jgi:hypothetical protein
MDNKLKEYIKAIVTYSKSDIETLLEKKINVAGPFIAAVVINIDALGGCYYGFKDPNGHSNSNKRSFLFMKEKMNIPNQLAAFLYKDVRCGIIHEGLPKQSVAIFADYDRKDQSDFIFKDEERIYINVIEFAFLYLKTLSKVQHEIDQNIELPERDTSAVIIPKYNIDSLKSVISKNMSDYWFNVCERGGASYSPFSLDNITLVNDSPCKKN